jgi:hypothetical protein
VWGVSFVQHWGSLDAVSHHFPSLLPFHYNPGPHVTSARVMILCTSEGSAAQCPKTNCPCCCLWGFWKSFFRLVFRVHSIHTLWLQLG